MVDSRDMTEATRELAVAAATYAETVQGRERAMSVLKASIRRADLAGVPRIHIAVIAGISRQTVYDALREKL